MIAMICIVKSISSIKTDVFGWEEDAWGQQKMLLGSRFVCHLVEFSHYRSSNICRPEEQEATTDAMIFRCKSL